jgi:hypothetical protein
VTAPFAFGDLLIGATSATRLQARYSRFNFTDGVNRDRVDVELTRSLLPEAQARLNLGWRSNVMLHNMQTNDFYSPLHFQSHLVVGQSSGRIVSWLDYSAEAAAGWQAEAMTPVLHPLQLAGKLTFRAGRNWGGILEAGRSTSSLDRPSAGLRAYNRRVISAGLQFRFR